MVLTNILKKNAEKFSKKKALTMQWGYRAVSLSFYDTYNLALRIACFLKKNGLGKGDKVLLLAPNSPYWIAIYWGCLLRGCAVVPLNIQSTGEMVKKIIDATEAKIIFKYVYFKESLPQNVKIYDIEFLKDILKESKCDGFLAATPDAIEISEDDIAEIMYTSGTTGEPKGVVLTHKNICSNLEAVSKIIPVVSGDKFLSVLPLSHIFEQTIGFLLPFSSGSQIVFAHSPAAVLELLKEHRITKMAAVPEFLRIVMDRIEMKVKESGRETLFKKILSLSGKIGRKPIQRILFWNVHRKFGGRFKTVASGGAPLDRELEEKWEALGVSLLQGYGLTETSPVVSCNTHEDRRIGSVGKILPGVEVKIAEDGEILVKGPNVFQGYFKNNKKTKEAFTADDWFKTDDIGEMDSDGFLYIKGRKKYMILGEGGQNVFPEDIESELNKIAGVKDSCAVGFEEAKGQIKIFAVILPADELRNAGEAEFEKIISEANKKLASYQQVAGWSVWPEDDFPRSATRKVKKEVVLKWLREEKRRRPQRPRRAESETATPMMRLLAEISGRDIGEITGETKIVPDLNLDSLLRIELVGRIGKKFGVEIEEQKIIASTTTSQLEEMVRHGAPAKEKIKFRHWPLWPITELFRVVAQILIVFSYVRWFVKLKIEGRENLRGLNLPAIFMPNHLSFIDPIILLMALPLKIRAKMAFAAAFDVVYEKYRRYAWLMELFFNSFPFPRREHQDIKSGLLYMGKLIDRGQSICIFPEGQISLTGEILPLKRGAGLAAIEIDCQIVPVKISGTQNIMPVGKERAILNKGEVIVKFGKPIKFKKSDSYIAATEKIQEELKKL